MISFKLFFESIESSPIVPQDIFSFYYLSLVKDTIDLSDEYTKDTVLNFFNTLRSKYLKTFGKVLRDQIAKYIRYTQGGRQRLVKGSELAKMNPEEFASSETLDYDQLEKFTKETTRSSGAANKEWNQLSEWLNKLSKKSVSINTIKAEGESLIFILDRINNCVHNTGASIFDKLKENGPALIRAFDEAHTVTSSSGLKNKIYTELKNLQMGAEMVGTSRSTIQDLEKQFAPSPSFYKRSGD